MSAERLREAARVLRERAEAATPGPWGWGGSGIASGDQIVARTDFTADFGLSREWLDANRHNGQYIATMHPGVGLALADWLDEVAGWREEGLGLIPYGNLGDAWTCIERQANVVADLILGDAP